MANEIVSPIPARLKNVAKGGHVAGASDIVDDALNKEQSVVNAERIADVARLDGEIDAVEQKVDDIGDAIQFDQEGDLVTVDGDDFQDPEARGKIPTIGAISDTYGSFVESPEFVEVVTDSEEKVLYGVKADGDFHFGAGVPNQIKEEIKNKISSKVDKVEGKSLIDAEYSEGIAQIESPEFIEVHTDAEDKVLYGVKTNGEFYFGAGVPSQMKDEIEHVVSVGIENKVDKETGKSLINADFASSQETNEDSDWLQKTKDSDGKIVGGRKTDGTLVENVGIEARTLTAEIIDVNNHLNLSESAKAQLMSSINLPSVEPAISLCGKDCVKTAAASIAAGGSMNIPNFPQYLKANGIITFSAKLTSFDDISVGFYTTLNPIDNLTNTIRVKVDDTNVYIIKGDDQNFYNHAHGLTIDDFITVTFRNDIFHPKIVVSSIDGSFIADLQEFVSIDSYGIPSVVLGSSTAVTNAELRVTSDMFSKPIWIFGDSGCSLYPERWAYQMIKNIGVDNFLLDAVAGGDCGQLYQDLQKALNYGTPKFLIWGLGANGTYAAWQTYFDRIKELCEYNGIELILQTMVPLSPDVVPTYTEALQITDAIKQSGYRYIDVADAVSPNGQYPWYEGYCSDGVHPTVLGAKVIAARFLSDFPELMH